MARTTKVLGFSIPPEVADAFEAMAQSEQRTKSELFREMFRLYQRYRTRQDQSDDAWIMQAIGEGQAAPLSEQELLRESEALATYGAQQAQALGYEDLDDEAIERIIHDYRREQRA
ncbi:MAG: hypothetical protein ETSY1_41340 [Candidatus Entotheonella factor]|uniref:Ribbon-helix-helix protein CopG domain-containing protein n=1 Tax=Entotheonella factor TaxID=1429438 RepID=W4L6J8_ENTF1|nr:MAG: hypothetical protein ETSY1_41340 [Candidatus Entotheonella factor]